MNNVTFTFRVDDELKEQFAKAAKDNDRNGAQLLRDFMRDFVRQQAKTDVYDTWFRKQVQDGIDSANAGNLISNDDVEVRFAARRATTIKRQSNAQ